MRKAEQQHEAEAIYEGLVQTRERDGAYYPAGDPLSGPDEAQLAAMPDDDPDVQLRRAYVLEKSTAPEAYEQARKLYRIARDRWGMDIKVVLGRDYLLGSNGVVQNAPLAKYWLTQAVQAGSHPAALYLSRWFEGSGGGAPDPVQARAWKLIGTEPPSSAPAAENLSEQQEAAARQIYVAWLQAHPGWEPASN